MRTYRCLVVDDEEIVHQRLARLFEKWRERAPELQLAGLAYSADEAVGLADRLRPDIVITDIVMPGRSGIELIEALQRVLPCAVYIVLSAYADFDYAQRAIGLGVLDYVVKVPLNEARLLEVLRRAQEKLLELERSSELASRLHHERREHIYRLRKRIMEEICEEGVTQPAELLRLKDSLLLALPDVSGDSVRTAMFALKVDRHEQFRAAYGSGDRKLLRFGMLNIMEEVMEQEGMAGFCCELGELRIAAVLLQNGPVSASQRNFTARQLGRRIIASIKSYLKLSVSIGGSRAYDGVAALPAAWREAAERLEAAFYDGPGSLALEEPGFALETDAAGTLHCLLARIAEPPRERDAAALETAFAHVRTELRTLRLAPQTLLRLLAEWLIKLGGGRQATADEALAFRRRSSGETDYDQLFEAWSTLCRRLTEAGERPGREREEIARSRQFIERRLTEPIYLVDVAAHVNMNPSYFSELFKKEVGEGLSEYVNRLRMERAVRLLTTRPYTNLELAEAVGINNERYFCTLFKKHTGVAPQKYYHELSRGSGQQS